MGFAEDGRAGNLSWRLLIVLAAGREDKNGLEEETTCERHASQRFWYNRSDVSVGLRLGGRGE